MKITTTYWKALFLSLIAGAFLLSCDKFEGDQEIPAYIHIDSIGFQAGFQQGSSSHKISDAWVYLDGELVGAYQLPVTLPVLETGIHTIMVKSGIKMNGIATTRVYYPFYKPYSINTRLTEDSITYINPSVGYYPTTTFAWMEDFESGGVSLESTINSDTIIEKTNEPGDVFEGLYSGVIYLDDSATIYEAATINTYELPTTGSPVFIELDYLINNPITIGLIGEGSGQIIQYPVLYIYANSEWNKVYINLTSTLAGMTSSSQFKIFIGAIKEDGVEHPKMLIDNLKLLYF